MTQHRGRQLVYSSTHNTTPSPMVVVLYSLLYVAWRSGGLISISPIRLLRNHQHFYPVLPLPLPSPLPRITSQAPPSPTVSLPHSSLFHLLQRASGAGITDYYILAALSCSNITLLLTVL